MFISFLYPINIRNTEAPYLWVFYKQLYEMYPEEVVFMGSKEYFYNPEYFKKKGRMEVERDNCTYNSYTVPSPERIAKYRKYIFDDIAIEKIISKYNKEINDVWRDLLIRRNELFEEEIEKVLNQIMDENKNVEGIIAWCNCPSLDHVAKKHNIRIIYNEIGPFRPPYYRYMAYFDFSGVNGNTECSKRYSTFKEECIRLNYTIPLFNREELLSFLSNYPIVECEEIYKVGVALQVEDDSNMLAYSKGYNNYRLIDQIKKEYPSDKILIRQHPSSHEDYSKLGCNMDDSPNSATFINKCSEVCTINSSVAIEAILYGKRTVIYGDSPFAWLKENDDEFLAKLNFSIINYLIPYQLLFCYDYYKWRMTSPDEIEIYYLHLYCLSGNEAYLKGDYESSLIKKVKDIVSFSRKERQMSGYLKCVHDQEKQLDELKCVIERIEEANFLLANQLEAVNIDKKRRLNENELLLQKLEMINKELNDKDKDNLYLTQKLYKIDNSKGMKLLKLFYKIRDFLV